MLGKILLKGFVIMNANVMKSRPLRLKHGFCSDEDLPGATVQLLQKIDHPDSPTKAFCADRCRTLFFVFQHHFEKDPPV